jgi:GNAT superfamily N-acetyltransferase
MKKHLTIRHYKKLSPRLFELLYENFTFPDGMMRVAMRKNSIVCIFIAFDDQKVVGWTAVYSDGDGWASHSVGVFVTQEYRHRGVGGKLRRKAILWAIQRNLKTYWYDASNSWQPCIATLETLGEQNVQPR